MFNLAIFTVSKAFEDKGVIYFNDPFLFFALKLANHFESSSFFCPRLKRRLAGSSRANYHRIEKPSDRIHIIESYPTQGMADFFLKLPVILIKDIKKYSKTIKRSDTVLLRLPSPACIVAFPMAKLYGKTVVAYYASDIKRVVFSGSKYKGILKHIATLFASFMFRLFKLVVEKSDAAVFLSTDLMLMHNNKNKFYSFASLVQEREIINKSYDALPKTEIGLLYAGRLTHEKGIGYLLKALSILLKENLSVHLTLCGEGPERLELERMAANLGIGNKVVFTGHISSKQCLGNIFENHHIFVMPSISEGTPKVLIEAMAKGLMIIATRVGGIPNVVIDKENGLLIKEKSEEEIVRAIKTILNNSSLQQKFLIKGHEFACKHTMRCQAEKIVKIIHSTLSEKKANTP